ncbi:hypothetical protein MGALJ_60040 (plasmid) [Mycobacterium gallinarum]|uniref:Uncharacterized protein n=1 Tax=Mycobacterium gallinarum TaxID=39689 RepID=A0A9W4BEC2_9MYCO|nr:hypothetical protein [Mycobacterium gallinarum]BBY96335.1 hypothetical protein MGALJ_60040 [Mycobacterium gallinarum]
MAHRFVIRRLGSLPWPPGLGKNAGPSHPYKQLERRLRAHLGSDRHYSAAAHKHAYLTGDPEYRRIVLHALCQMPWAAGLLDDVEAATALSRSAPLLDRPIAVDSQWDDWARPHCLAVGLSRAWLASPLRVCNQMITDGRHHLTYLRSPPTRP